MRAVFDPEAPKRIAVSAPPRHGKSELVCHALPTWFFELFPTNNVILTSYEATFAGKWGRKVRDTIEANPDKLRIRLRPDIAARHMWELTHECADGSRGGGGMVTAGAGGPVTGHGGDLIVIDDPHKNWEEALSKTYQQKIWDWYTGTLRDRIDSDNAVIILIMQRWCEGDLIGRLVKHSEADGEKWAFINLPAEAEEDDPLGRKEGAALWPERISLKMLKAMRAGLGSHKYSAKFQGNPKPDEGQIFKRSTFKYFRETASFYELVDAEGVRRVPKDKCWRFQTCDPAATEKELNDYFALLDVIVTPTADLLFSGMLREHAKTTKHKQIMRSAWERFKPAFQGVENKTFGLNIIQSCVEAGLPIKPLVADIDKVARARPLDARYEVGAVYHRAGAPWLEEFEDELTGFPNGDHDDQVDVAAYAAVSLPDLMDLSQVRSVGPMRTGSANAGGFPGA